MTKKTTLRRILIVDDDKDVAEIMKLIFNLKGFIIKIVTEYKRVYAEVEKFKPEVLLFDLKLAGPAGVIMCKHLQRMYSFPVILFTANNDIEAHALESVVDGFIKKPFDIDDIVLTINHFLEESLV
jgi:two-component system OmpR family response regulator